ncbi:MAG TPA: carbohydrate-binding protein [Pseudobdellovibrionaceae bacterium]|jgi:hypothetical protein
MKNTSRLLLSIIASLLCFFSFQNCGPAKLNGEASQNGSLDSASQSTLPDLVVSDFSLNPKNPQEGQSVIFSVTVINQGQASTPSGLSTDVAFMVDGIEVAKANLVVPPLNPGEAVAFTSNQGSVGTNGWISTAGSHSLKVLIKGNNLEETSTDNNLFEAAFTVQASATPCQFAGTSINSGQDVVAYQSSSVSFGSTCNSEARSCLNGTLSGTYQFASCSVGTAANCMFNGATIANGQNVTAYQASNVPFGSICSSQTRTCTNGTLSGTYHFNSCSVLSPLNCQFNGATIANGQNVTAYQASNVPFGSICGSQTRTCTNGTLSGTYQFNSCSVLAPTSTPYTGTPIPVPGSFEAEAYDQGGEGRAYHDNVKENSGGVFRFEDVDITDSTDTLGGGYVVNNLENGEWLVYTINATSSGSYTVGLRTSQSYLPNANFHLEIDNVPVTGSVLVSNTGSWDTFQWTYAPTITMTAGTHQLKIVVDTQYFNLNSIYITKVP